MAWVQDRGMSFASAVRTRLHVNQLDAAQALLLLTDGTSPLYCGQTADQAVGAIARIQAAL
jgi:hypothetical protein